MKDTVAERLRRHSSNFASAEQRVARVLFATGMIAGLETVAALGKRANVSGPTVLRLVGKLGFSRYEDFQSEIRAELEQRRHSPLSLHAAGRTPEDSILANSLEVFSQALAHSFTRLSHGEFDRVVDKLSDQKRTLILCGGRVSQLVAQMLYVHLFQMRTGVSVLNSAFQQKRDQLLDVGPRSVFVVFDFRRYEKETVQLAQVAKTAGATVVLVTDPWESPIANFADLVLSVDVTSPSAYDSLVSAFALVEALYSQVFERLKKSAVPRMAELERLRGGFEWEPSNEGATNGREKHK